MTDDILEALGAELRERRDRVDAARADDALARPLSDQERLAALDGAFARLALGEPDDDHELDDLDDDGRDDELDDDGRDDELDDDQASDRGNDGTTTDGEPRTATKTRDQAEPTRLQVVAGGRSEATADARDDIVPEAGRSRGMLVVLATVTALAAAFLLWWVTRSPASDPELVATLPSYEITQLAAGDAVVRSQPKAMPERVELRADGRVEIVLTPATPVRESVSVVIVAVPAHGEPIVRRPTEGVEVSPHGAVMLRGPLDRIVALTPGDWTLELLVGANSALPGDLEAWRSAPTPAPWRRLTVSVTIVDPG